MNIDSILSTAQLAVRVSMDVVRSAQGRRPSDTVTKEDQTIVTATDRASSMAAAAILRQTAIPLMSEDGEYNTELARYRHLLDPLDGTSAFAAGMMSSTVIWALYDTIDRKIIASIVGEPVSNRLWVTRQDAETTLVWHELEETQRHCAVDSSTLAGRKSTVFLDVSFGFSRGNRQILTDTDVSRVFDSIRKHSTIILPGSNGLMHALVANGGAGVAGSITTAMGGPWDVCGVLLVLNAGGFARAFSLSPTNRMLEERNPLAVEDYDILITANSENTLEKLTACLEASVSR